MNETAMKPITPAEISNMTEAVQAAQQDFAQAFALFKRAQDTVRVAFGNVATYDALYAIRHKRIRVDDLGDLYSDLKKWAWRYFYHRLEVRPGMSRARIQALQSMLEEEHKLPPFTTAEALAKADEQRRDELANRRELAKEVLGWLRPEPCQWSTTYKTNSGPRLGEKAVLAGVVERGYGGRWSASYNGRDKLEAIQNLFTILAGMAVDPAARCELVKAIEASDGKGETDYFTFKCFANGNLHLGFKWERLIYALNALALNDPETR